MKVGALRLYLENHLQNELVWCLRAATEWHVQHELQRRIDGNHIQVYAMDSTFLHARTLFEFFTKNAQVAKNPDGNYYTCDIFGVAPLSSSLYTGDWQDILHRYIMHAQNRSRPRKLKSYDNQATTKDLKDMPVDFAREVVRLWREFCQCLHSQPDRVSQQLATKADGILQFAITTTKPVLDKEGPHANITPITW